MAGLGLHHRGGGKGVRVYLVFRESGQYSDWFCECEGVHATYEGAVKAIESQVFERCELVALPAWRDQYGNTALPRASTVTSFEHPRRMPENAGRGYRDDGAVWKLAHDNNDNVWYVSEYEVMA